MQIIDECDLCGSTDSNLVISGHDRLYDQPGEFSLKECQNCGLIYLSPRPNQTELESHYPNNYLLFSKAIQEESSWLKRLDRNYGLNKRCQQIIRRAGSKGKLLDIGCATGIFLNGMKQRGWEVFGIEPVQYAAEYARKTYGLQVVNGYLEQNDYKSNFFDVVTMWDVLEHVPNPKSTLNEITRILKPGGFLVISQPNLDAWERKWFGKYWAGWEIPRHFHLFKLPVLEEYLRLSELSIQEVTSFTGRHGVFVLNVKFWLSDQNISDEMKKLILRIVSSLPIRLLTLPFFVFSDHLNKSSVIVIFSRKSLI